MVDVKGLAHIYAGGHRINFADWEIKAKEQWLLLGASGSGKSTLLNIISGLLKPSEGKVFVDGTALYDRSTASLDRFRGQKIGIVFQRPHLIRALTVSENLAIAASMAGLPVSKTRNMALLAALGLSDQAKKYPDELSQGQLQRVSVARALVNQPALLIADEPTSSLDDENALQVIKMLTEQAAVNAATLLVATHDHRIKNQVEKIYQL